jgi:hypothetical protein
LRATVLKTTSAICGASSPWLGSHMTTIPREASFSSA